MYKLYTDKNENFECDVNVKNASLKGSIARLIVESEGTNLVFNGKIEGEKCVIPIKRLKGLLDENTRGNMHLEIIVEDTYFKPWQSDFLVEEHTSVKVKVNEQKTVSNKPLVEVKIHPPMKHMDAPADKTPPAAKKKGINVYVPLQEISSLCNVFGITKTNIKSNRKDFKQLIKEYFVANPEYRKHQRNILSKISTFLK
jgi:hypothetical protein